MVKELAEIKLHKGFSPSRRPRYGRKEALAEFSTLLSDTLREQGRKLTWLAAQSGIHRNTISEYLHGEALPTPDNCRAIAAALDKNAGEFLKAARHTGEIGLLIPKGETEIEPEAAAFEINHSIRLNKVLEQLDSLLQTLQHDEPVASPTDSYLEATLYLNVSRLLSQQDKLDLLNKIRSIVVEKQQNNRQE
ncbi:MAG TPA: helix-turn-helix transcriptional regulator [Chloroflexia bacterium]|nr:helix-turn-helix transcriptional regulator [Chloroflexia bacterium]